MLYEVITKSSNSSVFTEKANIALVGVENITVVQEGNNILVISKDCSQAVRDVVDIIKKRATK